jgi:hypothetical protein
VDRGDPPPCADEVAREAISARLRAREDEHVLQVALRQEVAEEVLFLLLRDGKSGLTDGFDGTRALPDRDHRGRAERLMREPLDLGRHGRREEQRLPHRRQRLQYPPNVRQKAHVEHAVGFVENQDLEAGKFHRPPPHVIEQSARSRHHDVHSAPERLDLRRHPDAAENDRGAQRQILSVGAGGLSNLGSELAGRREDERANAPSGSARESLERREEEAGRFARASLRAAKQVGAAQSHRDGLRLDRRGCAVLGIGQRAKDLGKQPELGKRHSGNLLGHLARPCGAR